MSSTNGNKFNTPQFNANDELGCGSSVPGAPTVKEQARSTIFCKDVTINGSLTVKTSCEIIPAAIDVGDKLLFQRSYKQFLDPISFLRSIEGKV
jgi:hypothetical protein